MLVSCSSSARASCCRTWWRCWPTTTRWSAFCLAKSCTTTTCWLVCCWRCRRASGAAPAASPKWSSEPATLQTNYLPHSKPTATIIFCNMFWPVKQFCSYRHVLLFCTFCTFCKPTIFQTFVEGRNLALPINEYSVCSYKILGPFSC